MKSKNKIWIRTTNRVIIGLLMMFVITGSIGMPVNAATDAPAPTITGQPQGKTVNEGDPSITLSVTASGSGTLSYQWYRNSTNSYMNGVALNGATSATYVIPTSAPRDDYFYVMVTNTDNTVPGIKTASVRSDFAHVTVNELADAPAPTISVQPQGKTVNEGDPSITLSVTASGSGT
ncbi:immunoglobulin domain-containing protein, partial [Paenibacillus sp. J5C_2022]|uniref:immunoglobulin domain-containing protein n=1 Tax=Paenibacillus sp. J5C2022 TaxID=2977129 RepID=UPI0021D274FE